MAVQEEELSPSSSLVDLLEESYNDDPTRDEDWPDIITFAESPQYCNLLGRGVSLYPRQQSILKLIYAPLLMRLEEERNCSGELITDYDWEVWFQWAEWFRAPEPNRFGVPSDIDKRIDYLHAEGYDHFREVEFIGGRRGSKGLIGGILGAYQAYKLLKMGNPQRKYGIEFGKDLLLYVTAPTEAQAKANHFADLYNTITNAPCFHGSLAVARTHFMGIKTFADHWHEVALREAKVPAERLIASLRFQAVSSNSRSARGMAAFCLMFDEFAHMIVGTEGPATAEEVYKAQEPSLDQLKKDGLIYIPSSPYTKVGKAYDIYQSGTAIDPDTGEPVTPETLIIQLASWQPYEDWDHPDPDHRIKRGRRYTEPPSVYDARMKRMERTSPDDFMVERKAQWATVQDAYLRPEVVDRMFFPFRPNTGEPVDPVGLKDDALEQLRFLVPQENGIIAFRYRGHADPSESQANFAVAFGHTEPFDSYDEIEEKWERWHHVIFDWMHVWKPGDYEDHQVPYDDIEKELASKIAKFPSMEVFSFDQFGSFVTVPQMRARAKKTNPGIRVLKYTHTPLENTLIAERFKAALGLGWVHSYKDDFFLDDGLSLLEHELKFLQVKRMSNHIRVVKQEIGPVTTDDLADCVMVITSELLKDQLDRAEKRGRLGGQRIRTTAPGGYHTGMDPPQTQSQSIRSEARSKLSGIAGRTRGQYRRPPLR